VGPIVIVGALGQLGQALRRRLAHRSPITLDLGELDVGDPAAVDRCVEELRPTAVLNTSAFNHVDDAELRPDEAFRTNALGPWALARATDACGALLVHFSTDYVFRGDACTPYGEDDVPAPQSVYGASKLAGERLVACVNPFHMVIRTAALYGPDGQGGKGRNFVNTMVRLGAEGRAVRVVDDQRVSPTSTDDLARKVVELVARWTETRTPELLGLYHVTNAGSCSWFELARETFRLCGARSTVEPVTTVQYGARARRPAYSVLARRHLERLGLDDLRPWQEALADYLSERLNPPSGI